ncbi:sulfatase family protein [Flavicella sediminum]|uniref:sulfatase family protein n=1 Tax=Flavicella sediminum TaxID=2585141 RepID=UPI0011201C5E|nr:sulfatase [Flavicella sediminum]
MKNYISIVTVVLTLISCGSKSQESKKEAPKKPNIIWLMAEDMSTDLECYGMPNVKTPHLNKMAAEGIRFNNAFVTNPICSPSRSSMMVGTHQVKTNSHHHRSNRNVPLDAQFKPFTKLLRDAGYTTILGHEKVYTYGQKIDVNFRHTPLGPWDGKENFGLFDKTNTFTKADEPFFAQIQLKVTHRGPWWTEIREKSKHPVNPKTLTLPEYMADHPAIRLDWAKYLDQVEYMDDEVGMIFKELEEKGMADNTIVIFIGDNGRCNIRGKGYLQDPGLRIPFIMHYPKGIKAGQVSDKVVASTDITATIIDAAGIEVPSYMTGKAIFDKGFDRKYVYGARDLWDEIMEDSRSITSGEWSYIRNDKPELAYDAHQAYLEFYRPAVHVMRQLYKEGKLNENQKPFFEPTKPKEELYHMKNDPQQLHNLATNPEYTDVLEKMRKEIAVFDKEIVPVSDVFEPTIMTGPAVVKWLQETMPKDYKKMQEGEEIGYKRITGLWKKATKNSKKKK